MCELPILGEESVFTSSREVQVCPSLIHGRRESEAGDWADDLMVDLERGAEIMSLG